MTEVWLLRLQRLLGAVAIAAALHQLYNVHHDRVLD